MNESRVSIIIPVYKVEDYISKTIDSVLSQDYSNIELILIDDGSPDKSGSICDNYAILDSRITVIHKSNGGVSSARKMGLERATGDWIVFLDGDDLLHTSAVSFFVKKGESLNVDMVNTPFTFSSSKGIKIQKFKETGVFDKDEYVRLLISGRINFGIGGKAYRKHLFTCDIINVSPVVKNNEDLIMNLRMSEKINKVLVTNETAPYIYLIRSTSASHSIVSLKNYECVFSEILSKADQKLSYNFIIDSLWNAYIAKKINSQDLSKLIEEFNLQVIPKTYRRSLMLMHLKTGIYGYYILIKILLLVENIF